MFLRLLLLGSLAVKVMAGGHFGLAMPGSPYPVSTDDHGVQEAVLAAAASFNKRVNDAFLFKPSAVLRAQRQVVKGIRYIVDSEISRTVCRKGETHKKLSDCDFQPEGHLHQTFQCHFEVWAIPWKSQMKTLVSLCEP